VVVVIVLSLVRWRRAASAPDRDVGAGRGEDLLGTARPGSVPPPARPSPAVVAASGARGSGTTTLTVIALVGALLALGWWAHGLVPWGPEGALLSVVFATGLAFIRLGVRLDRRTGADETMMLGGRLAGDAGIALTTSAAVGFVLFLATSNLEHNLLEQGARRDDVRFVREMATATERRGAMPFSGLDLRDAGFRRFDFAGADFAGAQLQDADLAEAVLRGARLSDADLTNAELADADLTAANLIDAILRDVELRDANLTAAYLRGATLAGAGLSGARFDGANLTEADLSGADLVEAKFHGANLHAADLFDADLRRADLSRVSLTGADLSEADLSGADLTNAELDSADLSGANLTDALLAPADLSGADLSDADLRGADLTGVVYDSSTIWPQGVERPGSNGDAR
jgi:uncharacterized protein YjbI with pentapeptide repeats